MSSVYLSIGSNIERESNIRSCLVRLGETFPNVRLSSIYESPAEGFEGHAFYNLAAEIQTTWSFERLSTWLKQLEDEHKRERNGVKFSSRTLDVDILLFDDLILQPKWDIPRDEILRYTFVLYPLAEIAADVIHPQTGLSIAEHLAQSSLDFSSLVKKRL